MAKHTLKILAAKGSYQKIIIGDMLQVPKYASAFNILRNVLIMLRNLVIGQKTFIFERPFYKMCLFE